MGRTPTEDAMDMAALKQSLPTELTNLSNDPQNGLEHQPTGEHDICEEFLYPHEVELLRSHTISFISFSMYAQYSFHRQGSYTISMQQLGHWANFHRYIQFHTY